MFSYQIVTYTSFGAPVSVIKRLPDNAFIPADPDNTDYQTYLVWLDAGNEPDKVNQ